MTHLTFVVTCSPYVAIRTTWKAAEESNQQLRTEVVKAVKTNMFDYNYLGYLGSSETVSDGAREAMGVDKALSDADFHLQGWLSNSPDFLKFIGRNVIENGTQVSHPFGKAESEMVLGLVWHWKTDSLGFRVITVEGVSYPRIGLLNKVASLLIRWEPLRRWLSRQRFACGPLEQEDLTGRPRFLLKTVFGGWSSLASCNS